MAKIWKGKYRHNTTLGHTKIISLQNIRLPKIIKHKTIPLLYSVNHPEDNTEEVVVRETTLQIETS